MSIVTRSDDQLYYYCLFKRFQPMTELHGASRSDVIVDLVKSSNDLESDKFILQYNQNGKLFDKGMNIPVYMVCHEKEDGDCAVPGMSKLAKKTAYLASMNYSLPQKDVKPRVNFMFVCKEHKQGDELIVMDVETPCNITFAMDFDEMRKLNKLTEMFEALFGKRNDESENFFQQFATLLLNDPEKYPATKDALTIMTSAWNKKLHYGILYTLLRFPFPSISKLKQLLEYRENAYKDSRIWINELFYAPDHKRVFTALSFALEFYPDATYLHKYLESMGATTTLVSIERRLIYCVAHYDRLNKIDRNIIPFQIIKSVKRDANILLGPFLDTDKSKATLKQIFRDNSTSTSSSTSSSSLVTSSNIPTSDKQLAYDVQGILRDWKKSLPLWTAINEVRLRSNILIEKDTGRLYLEPFISNLIIDSEKESADEMNNIAREQQEEQYMAQREKQQALTDEQNERYMMQMENSNRMQQPQKEENSVDFVNTIRQQYQKSLERMKMNNSAETNDVKNSVLSSSSSSSNTKDNLTKQQNPPKARGRRSRSRSQRRRRSRSNRRKSADYSMPKLATDDSEMISESRSRSGSLSRSRSRSRSQSRSASRGDQSEDDYDSASVFDEDFDDDDDNKSNVSREQTSSVNSSVDSRLSSVVDESVDGDRSVSVSVDSPSKSQSMSRESSSVYSGSRRSSIASEDSVGDLSYASSVETGDEYSADEKENINSRPPPSSRQDSYTLNRSNEQKNRMNSNAVITAPNDDSWATSSSSVFKNL